MKRKAKPIRPQKRRVVEEQAVVVPAAEPAPPPAFTDGFRKCEIDGCVNPIAVGQPAYCVTHLRRN